MLIQHNDTNKSTNIFQDQQSQVKDLMGVLWLKKLFVNKKKELVSPNHRTRELLECPCTQVTTFHGLDPSVSRGIFVAKAESDSSGCLSFTQFSFQIT